MTLRTSPGNFFTQIWKRFAPCPKTLGTFSFLITIYAQNIPRDKENAILLTMLKKMRRPNYSCSLSETDEKNFSNEKNTLSLILFLGICRMLSWQLRWKVQDRRPKSLFQYLKLFNEIFYLIWKIIKISKKIFVLKKVCWTGKLWTQQSRCKSLETEVEIFSLMSENDSFLFQ